MHSDNKTESFEYMNYPRNEYTNATQHSKRYQSIKMEVNRDSLQTTFSAIDKLQQDYGIDTSYNIYNNSSNEFKN